jgi:hypothetical protein
LCLLRHVNVPFRVVKPLTTATTLEPRRTRTLIAMRRAGRTTTRATTWPATRDVRAETTRGDGCVTVTFAVAVSVPDVAVIVTGPGWSGAVKRPEGEIVPADALHVAVTGTTLPYASFPETASWSRAPVFTVALAGVTPSDAGAAGVTVSSCTTEGWPATVAAIAAVPARVSV